MSVAWFRAANEADIASPALLLVSERIDANLRQMLAIAGGPARLRPHVKTHKLAPLVERQVALGISRFKCATIAEAEMIAAAGAREVLLAYPCVGPNPARLCALARKFPAVHFAATADDAGATRALGEAVVSAGLTLDVFIDLDCGMHRTGIEPGPRARELWNTIRQTPGLHAAGLHAYDGHIHDPDPATRRAQCDVAFAPVVALRQVFGDVRLIAGGSPTFALHAEHPDRELSPGTTVLWDFGYAEKFPELPFEPAAVLLTRVVSRPTPDRLCLDLGYKAVASENPHPRVRLLEIPEATAVIHSEEHLVVETPRAAEFAIGDTLHGIPRHICPTVALYDTAWLVEGGLARERWPILARSRAITI
jgi:D-serine deaminase-like pyridoxal phosphate-dependent protein